MSLDLPLLLADLASARSDLLWSVSGLDEAALVSPSDSRGRSGKDVLAHLAYWETWTTDQLHMVSAGRSAELPRADVDGDNDRVLAQRRDWPLCRVMAELTNAHAALLYQVDQWTSETLDARHPAPWGSVRPARWLEKSLDHDQRHAAEFTAWRQSIGRLDHTSGPGCVLVAALQASREELMSLVSLLPGDERATRPVCGLWTARDVLGHVADWDSYIARALAQMASGESGGDPYADLETWNTAHAAARQSQTWDQTVADLNAARAAILAAVTPLSDAALCAPAASHWNANDSAYGMAHVSLEHDRDHARGLRQALAQG